jgi:hypothetical protein
VLLVLALLLAATAVVPVLLLGDADADGAAAGVAPGPPFNSSRVKAVSWQPRIFVYKGFLSDAECDHLVRLGKKKVHRSMVADNDSGKSVMSEVRTSSGTFLDKRQVTPPSHTHLPLAHCQASACHLCSLRALEPTVPCGLVLATISEARTPSRSRRRLRPADRGAKSYCKVNAATATHRPRCSESD